MDQQAKVMVVDDEKIVLRIMESMLNSMGHQVILVNSGREVIEQVNLTKPDLILLDWIMPDIDGYEVVKKLKSDPDSQFIPVVMVSSLQELEYKIKAIQAGVDDFLSKPVDKLELTARVQSLLKMKRYSDYMQNYQKLLEQQVEEKTEQLSAALSRLHAFSHEIISILAEAAEYKDQYTGGHIQRISHYCAAIASKLGLSEQQVENYFFASITHDIGKIGIPEQILLKNGKLDEDEWETMMLHPYIGHQILGKSQIDMEIIDLAKSIALSHHEKWDGSGYPQGLKGEEIPLGGRIVALVDVFDALTSRRPYKEPFSIEKSFAIIQEGRGSHFDPKLVDIFFAVKDDILQIQNKYLD